MRNPTPCADLDGLRVFVIEEAGLHAFFLVFYRLAQKVCSFNKKRRHNAAYLCKILIQRTPTVCRAVSPDLGLRYSQLAPHFPGPHRSGGTQRVFSPFQGRACGSELLQRRRKLPQRSRGLLSESKATHLQGHERL